MMAKPTIEDVATYIFENYGKDTITQMTLYKLLWFCQGWHCKATGKSLFDDKFVAWQYGPLSKKLWDLYQDRINLELVDFKGDTSKIKNSSKEVIDTVIKHYGKYSSSVLTKLSFKCPTWIETWEKTERLGRLVEIPNESIREYFCGLTVPEVSQHD